MPYLRIDKSIWCVGRGAWGGHAPLSGLCDSNAYMVGSAKFAILVDCGMRPGCENLAFNVREAGVEPTSVRSIVLTHSHYDHSGGAASWQREFGAQIVAHQIAATYLASEDLRLVGHAIHHEQIFYQIPKIDRAVTEGDILPVEGTTLRVIYAPGHTPDLICLRGEIDGVDTLFSSDCVIGNQGAVKGCVGWLDGYWRSNIYDYAQTLERLLADPPERLLPGHGVPIVGLEAVLDSLRECRKRIQYLIDMPDVGTTLPITGPDPSYRR